MPEQKTNITPDSDNTVLATELPTTSEKSQLDLSPESATKPIYQTPQQVAEVRAEVAAKPEYRMSARPGERDMSAEEENRAKMLASGVISSTTPSRLAQEKVNLFTYGVEAPVFSAAITSDRFADEVGKQKTSIDQQLTDVQGQLGKLETPEYKYYEDYRPEIQKERDLAKDIYERTKETIQKDFEVRQEEQRITNRQQTGLASKQLAQMGAYGRTGSGISFIQQVQVQNERELTKVLVQKEKLLLQADAAYLSQDWEMLNTLMNESKALTDQYNDIQQQMFQDQIASNDQLMKQNRFGWEMEDRAMGRMSGFIETGIKLDAETAAELEKQAGVPAGVYDQLTAVNQQAAGVAEAEFDLELQTKIWELAAKVPAGQAFQIGDSIYLGMKEGKWLTETDRNGNVTVITRGEDGEIIATPLGNIGAGKDGWTLKEADGQLWRVNTQTGTALPVTSQQGTVDPSNYDGFLNWVSTIGQVTVGFGESTPFEASHPGWDIAPPGAKAGQYQVTSFLPDGVTGTITAVNTVDNNAFGKFVQITDSTGQVWQYGHFDSVGVAVGDNVDSGSYLGQMGNTGNVSSVTGGDGTHLDLRVFERGKQLTTKPGTTAKLLDQGLYSREEFTESQNYLSQFIGDDGFVDTGIYNELFEIYKNNYKRGAELFLEKFPPTQYLNPEDRTADFFRGFEGEEAPNRFR